MLIFLPFSPLRSTAYIPNGTAIKTMILRSHPLLPMIKMDLRTQYLCFHITNCRFHFSNYLARPNITQPIFTQYCDGRQVSCPNWMRQWESKTLGDRGYSAIEILRYFYGNSMYIASSEEISGVPSSWPGSDLTIGSSGQKVRQLQQQLNTIAGAYPLIPKLAVDGIYGKRQRKQSKPFNRSLTFRQQA